jgi:hypothetical protein
MESMEVDWQAALTASAERQVQENAAREQRRAEGLARHQRWEAVWNPALAMFEVGVEPTAAPLIPLGALLRERGLVAALECRLQQLLDIMPRVSSGNAPHARCELWTLGLVATGCNADEAAVTKLLQERPAEVREMWWRVREVLFELKEAEVLQSLKRLIENPPESAAKPVAKQPVKRTPAAQIDATLFARLLQHHEWEDGKASNRTPLEQKQLCVATGLPESTVCNRFRKWFGGQAEYEAACQSGRIGLVLLKVIGEMPSFRQLSGVDE